MIVRRILLLAAFCVFCAPSALAADSEEHEISVGGRDRNYRIYHPTSLDPQAKASLVIVLHGGFGTAEQAERSYGWDAEADKKHFIVAYPDGIRFSWNAGGVCCGKAAKDHVDDIDFITQVIADIAKSDVIDPKRVYLTGISNGAAMAYRYACEGPYPVAAIGPVAGSLSMECPSPHTVSVMEIHGLNDRHIPMAGGYGSQGFAKVDWMPVNKVIDTFRHANHCGTASVSKNGPVQVSSANCPAHHDVTLITIESAGHQWPGGTAHGMLAGMVLPLDPPSAALNATDTLWRFFDGHKGF